MIELQLVDLVELVPWRFTLGYHVFVGLEPYRDEFG